MRHRLNTAAVDEFRDRERQYENLAAAVWNADLQFIRVLQREDAKAVAAEAAGAAVVDRSCLPGRSFHPGKPSAAAAEAVDKDPLPALAIRPGRFASQVLGAPLHTLKAQQSQ